MKRFLPLLLLATSCPFFGQSTGHRQNTVLQRGNNTSAVVVPFAQIRVCVAGTASTGCTSQPVYSNYALTLPALQPIVADKSGNYDYYTGTACVDEIISSPGTATRVLPYVCNVATAGVGSVTAVSATGLSGLFGANVANPNTTPALSFTAISQPNSTIFGNFSGSSAAPQFYTLAAGTNMSFGISGNTLTLNSTGGGGGGGISGSGTTGAIPRFLTSTSVGDSLLTDDGTTLTYTGTGGITTTSTVTTNYAPSLPGYNFGSPGVGTSTGNYSIAAQLLNPHFTTQGIASGLSVTCEKDSNGDLNCPLNAYSVYAGASTDGSGEGFTGDRNYLTLGATPFTATVTGTTATTGGLQLAVTSPNDQSYGVGRIAIDTTNDVQSTNVTAASTVSGDQTTSGNYDLVTISGTAAASVQGTLAAAVAGGTPSTSFAPTMAQVQVTTGSAWNAGDFFTIGGTFIESAHVLSTATTPAAPANPTYAGGVATFYAELRYAHKAGSIAFARGWTGRYLEQVAQTESGTPPIRHLFYVMGAPSTTQLAVAAQMQNGMDYGFLGSTGAVKIYHGAPIVDARNPATGNVDNFGMTLAETDGTFASAALEVPNGLHQVVKMWAEQVGSNNPYADIGHFVSTCLVGPTCGSINGFESMFDLTNENPRTAYTMGGGSWNANDVFSVNGPYASFAYFGEDAPQVFEELQHSTTISSLFAADDTQGYISFVSSSGGADNTWHFDGYHFVFDAGVTGGAATSVEINGSLKLDTLSDGCLTIASHVLGSTGAPCGTGGGTGFPITLGSTVISGSSTTTTVAGLTIDGVSPTTMGFLDATSSIQTQLNAKAPLASPTFTGTVTLPITGSTQCLHVSSAGVVSGTGSDCGASGSTGFPFTLGSTSIAASSTVTSVAGLAVDGVSPTTLGYLDATSSVQTQLNSKLSGSGTVGQLAKFTGSAAVSSSLVSDDGTTLTYSGTGGMQLTGSGSSFIATGTTSNTDLAGKLTLSAGSATYTFARTHASAPICVATDTTATNAVKVSTTTTVLTITGTGTDAVNYICIGGTS